MLVIVALGRSKQKECDLEGRLRDPISKEKNTRVKKRKWKHILISDQELKQHSELPSMVRCLPVLSSSTLHIMGVFRERMWFIVTCFPISPHLLPSWQLEFQMLSGRKGCKKTGEMKGEIQQVPTWLRTGLSQLTSCVCTWLLTWIGDF